MSVRKRKWTTPRGGEERTAWVADHVDVFGRRRLKTFDRKGDAVAFSEQNGVNVRSGVQTHEMRMEMLVRRLSSVLAPARGLVTGLEAVLQRQRPSAATRSSLERLIGIEADLRRQLSQIQKEAKALNAWSREHDET